MNDAAGDAAARAIGAQPTLGTNVDVIGQLSRDSVADFPEPYIDDTLQLLTGGRLNLRPTVGADVPGINTRVAPNLSSPSADEVAGGITKQIGTRALLRIDGVYRKYEDFYATRIDQSTGQVVNELGDEFDVIVTENTNDVERKYAGLNLSGSWRPGRLTLGIGYTLSRTWGNIDGETSNSGPVPTAILEYPE